MDLNQLVGTSGKEATCPISRLQHTPNQANTTH